MEPTEIKLVEDNKIVLYIHCFHFITVLISKQKNTEVFDCQLKIGDFIHFACAM